MRKYELMTVFEPSDSFETHKTFIAETLAANGVKITEEKDMGELELAQPISEKKRAHYYLYNIDAEHTSLPEIERAFKIHKGLLRYMFIKK